MALGDGDAITVMKDMGLVTTVFDERKLSGLRGHLGIGHTRYSTAGSASDDDAQPVVPGRGESRLRSGPQRQPDQASPGVTQSGRLSRAGDDRRWRPRGGPGLSWQDPRPSAIDPGIPSPVATEAGSDRSYRRS